MRKSTEGGAAHDLSLIHILKASIVIPNLNGAGWLRDSIESIWAQMEQDFELIIIDNGSTDESLAIARSYVGRPGYTLSLIHI